MTNLELFSIAVGLSMDVFAVSLSLGLTNKDNKLRKALMISIIFGLFHIFMPLSAYLFASVFLDYIKAFDHWIAFFLLGFIGIKMLRESFSNEESETLNIISISSILFLSVATSIDSLAAGVSFAVLSLNLIKTLLTLGIVCSLFTFFGFLLGDRLGKTAGKRSEALGGIVLIIIGFKILLT